MDKEVFGGDYKGHFGPGRSAEVKLTDAGENHPILKGVKPFKSTGSLYKNPAVAKDVTVLLTGDDPEAIGAGGVGPRAQGRPGVLHVARPPGRLQGRELHPDADERDLLDGEEGRAGEVIGYNDGMKHAIDPRRIEVMGHDVAAILREMQPYERVAKLKKHTSWFDGCFKRRSLVKTPVGARIRSFAENGSTVRRQDCSIRSVPGYPGWLAGDGRA